MSEQQRPGCDEGEEDRPTPYEVMEAIADRTAADFPGDLELQKLVRGIKSRMAEDLAEQEGDG